MGLEKKTNPIAKQQNKLSFNGSLQDFSQEFWKINTSNIISIRCVGYCFSDKHSMQLLYQLLKLSEFRRKNGRIYRKNKEKKNGIMSKM